MTPPSPDANLVNFRKETNVFFLARLFRLLPVLLAGSGCLLPFVIPRRCGDGTLGVLLALLLALSVAAQVAVDRGVFFRLVRRLSVRGLR